MRNYLLLQLKRAIKLLPIILIVAIAILSGILTVFSSYSSANESENSEKLKIGIVGNTDESYFDTALSVLQVVDSSRFSVETVRLDEQTAKQKLSQSEITAYAQIPDGFITAALYGEIKPIKIVTAPKSVGLISIFKEEIADIIENILEQSQSGVFGIYNALDANGNAMLGAQQMNNLNFKYIDFVFDRSNMYSITELGISNGLSFSEYLLCGLLVLFISLMTLAFSHLYIRHDNSLASLMYAQRKPIYKQILSEYTAFSVVMLIISILTVLAFNIANLIIPNSLFSNIDTTRLVLHAIPITLLLSSFSFLIYEISENIISGVLSTLFFILILCYSSGCIYPIYTLPVSLQKLSVYLPTGICRSYFETAINFDNSNLQLLAIILYTLLFIVICCLVRRYKITRRAV